MIIFSCGIELKISFFIVSAQFLYLLFNRLFETETTAVEHCSASLGGFKEALTRQANGSAQWAGLKLVSGCIPY